MTIERVDVVVVGGGPAGYSAAERCARRGLRVVLVEGGHLGGTCLNVGCIPSKALIHASERLHDVNSGDLGTLGISATRGSIDLTQTMAWKDDMVDRLRRGLASLVGGAGVVSIKGWATIVDGKTVEVALAGTSDVLTVHCQSLVLAPGSKPVELAGTPFGGRVISSTEALSLSDVPHRLLVVGAGYIGLELGTAFRKLGAQVTIIDIADQLLPSYDEVLVRPIARRLDQLGVDVQLNTQLNDVDASEADFILVAVGRCPNTMGWNLESLMLDMAGPFIQIDSHCQTSMRGVYAIGDVTGEPMLAHRAMAQAEVVADHIGGGTARWDHLATPAVCFTDPELLSVGELPEPARVAGRDVVIGVAPFSANGRALTVGRGDGFVRVVGDLADHTVIGVQAVGASVSELSAAAASLVEMRATLRDVTLIMHAHPTMSEGIHDAARKALDRAVFSNA